jgi:hypothetical protein
MLVGLARQIDSTLQVIADHAYGKVCRSVFRDLLHSDKVFVQSLDRAEGAVKIRVLLRQEVEASS